MKQIGKIMMGILAGLSLVCAAVYSARGRKRHRKVMTFREIMDDNISAGAVALYYLGRSVEND